MALAYPQIPILILPSAGLPIIWCAETLFKGLAEQKIHFVRNEELVTILLGTGSAPVRLPCRAEILVRTDRVIVHLSGNSANLAKDLANRCIITNSRKQSGPKALNDMLFCQDFLRKDSRSK
jgi:hypothetical protein